MRKQMGFERGAFISSHFIKTSNFNVFFLILRKFIQFSSQQSTETELFHKLQNIGAIFGNVRGGGSICLQHTSSMEFNKLKNTNNLAVCSVHYVTSKKSFKKNLILAEF